MATDGSLESAQAAILQPSKFERDEKANLIVRGLELRDGDREAISVDEFAASMMTTGFQATNLGLAMEEIRKMLTWRLSDEPVKETDWKLEPSAKD